MRVQVLQHVPFEGPGSIQLWLDRQAAEVRTCCFFAAPLQLPVVDDVDLLIVLGGPMSVHDEQLFPWLVDEKAFIRACIAADKPILGICLGAQLIADVLGARVYPAEHKEIGWFPIRRRAVADNLWQLPESLDAFHWHGETFDLPDKAVLLASSEACSNQAFQLGQHIVGLQFHLETTPESAESIISNSLAELSPGGPYVQSADQLRCVDAASYTAINQQMFQLLDYLTRDIKSSSWQYCS